MQGFEDSKNPCYLFLSADSGLGTGPFEIDGAVASLTADGIRADVGGKRYFVPMHLVDRVEQQQTSGPTPTEPVRVPPTPPSTGGGSGGGDGAPPRNK